MQASHCHYMDVVNRIAVGLTGIFTSGHEHHPDQKTELEMKIKHPFTVVAVGDLAFQSGLMPRPKGKIIEPLFAEVAAEPGPGLDFVARGAVAREPSDPNAIIARDTGFLAIAA